MLGLWLLKLFSFIWNEISCRKTVIQFAPLDLVNGNPVLFRAQISGYLSCFSGIRGKRVFRDPWEIAFVFASESLVV